ncbi:MAG: serine hydrolase [Actinobacteria bacterium]|uniref:Unannotated protein n=1 Tax=freshwater metagenome TaxID=449393 RepID=A0A6J6PX12_9ZZZZ|nr:serine hydrolase [Actinomycetota bacterium]
MDVLRQVETWGCPNVAVATAGAIDATYGDATRPFGWASVTKLATAIAALVAVEEGVIDLDEPAGPPGATVRHLLAHASGLPFDGGPPIAEPGRRRIYSNAGFDALGTHVAERSGVPFPTYFREVWGFELTGSPGAGVVASLVDLITVAHELLQPTRIAPEMLLEARTVQFPGLDGVLPGFGRQTPNDWGLGLELRSSKAPHWTGARNSAATFGHFGASGTFLWVDPVAGLAVACLTDRPFDAWATEVWPVFSDAVLDAARAA